VFHLAGIDPGAHPVAERLGSGDRPGRAVEHGQCAVARGIHQSALVAAQLPADQLVEPVDQVAGPAVAERKGRRKTREQRRGSGFPRLQLEHYQICPPAAGPEAPVPMAALGDAKVWPRMM